jgi:hypothetical protein
LMTRSMQCCPTRQEKCQRERKKIPPLLSHHRYVVKRCSLVACWLTGGEFVVLFFVFLCVSQYVRSWCTWSYQAAFAASPCCAGDTRQRCPALPQQRTYRTSRGRKGLSLRYEQSLRVPHVQFAVLSLNHLDDGGNGAIG